MCKFILSALFHWQLLLLAHCFIISFFCIFTAHTCNLPLQGCKTGSHLCGGFRRAANRPRIYAGSVTRLQIDLAYMRGALHGCFAIPHICAVRCIIRQGRCRPARARRRPVSCPCWRWGSSWHVCGSIRGLRSCVSQGRRPRARRGSSQRKR